MVGFFDGRSGESVAFPKRYEVWSTHWRDCRHAAIWTAKGIIRRSDRFDYVALLDKMSCCIRTCCPNHLSVIDETLQIMRDGERSDTSPEKVLKKSDEDVSDCSEVSLHAVWECDMRLAWPRADEIKWSWFSRAATWDVHVDTEEMDSMSVEWEFTVHPNVFTEKVWIPYRYSVASGMSSLAESWECCALHNRSAASTVVRSLVESLELPVSAATSDLVDGVTNEGFSEVVSLLRDREGDIEY